MVVSDHYLIGWVFRIDLFFWPNFGPLVATKWLEMVVSDQYLKKYSSNPTLLFNVIQARWAQFCKDGYIISTSTPSCPATGTAWLWGLAQVGAWLCYPLRWLSIYNKEWDIAEIQTVSLTQHQNCLRKHWLIFELSCIWWNFSFWQSCMFCPPCTWRIPHHKCTILSILI